MKNLKESVQKFVFVLVLSIILTVVSGVAGIPAFFALAIYSITGHISLWSSYLVMTSMLVILFYVLPRHRTIW